MADTPSRVATLLEIAALQAVHGAEEAVIDAAEVQQLVDAACEGALEEEVAAAQLGSSSIDLTIHVTAAAPPPLQASLRVRLPAAYPGGGGGCSGLQAGSDPVTAGTVAFAAAAAAICSVGPPTQMACGGAAGAAVPGGRGWCDSCTTQMAALASSAAQEGRHCLHELVEAVQAALSDLGQQLLQQQQGQQGQQGQGQGQQEETSAAAAAAGAWGDGGADADEVLLVKLDHMHNRGMYCRTLAAWVKELGLTGRLVFGPSGLLLELLTGPPARLRAYLVRHRTEAVDVDSRGRKCKERMMEVIGQRACGSSSTSSNSGGGGCGQRTFTDYREVQLSSLDEVAQLLEAAGVGDWLRPAVGLPPVAATR